MARRKCDAAQTATNAQRNGTAKTSSAETWTVQKIAICTMFGSTRLDLSKRSGDWNSGRANSGKQAADRSHHRGKQQTTGQQGWRDSELERHFAEAGEVRGAGRQTVD